MIFVESRTRVSDYQEAIRLTCEVLHQNNITDGRYYQAIIDNIQTHGGYFYLGDGVCMPHANANAGVRQPGICVLRLREPVDFFGESVRLFFTLAAIDSQHHLELMKNVVRVCSSKESIHALLEADSEAELYKLLEGET